MTRQDILGKESNSTNAQLLPVTVEGLDDGDLPLDGAVSMSTS